MRERKLRNRPWMPGAVDTHYAPEGTVGKAFGERVAEEVPLPVWRNGGVPTKMPILEPGRGRARNGRYSVPANTSAGIDGTLPFLLLRRRHGHRVRLRHIVIDAKFVVCLPTRLQ